MRKLDKHIEIFEGNLLRDRCLVNLHHHYDQVIPFAWRIDDAQYLSDIRDYMIADPAELMRGINNLLMGQLIQEIQAIMPVNPARFGELPTD